MGRIREAAEDRISASRRKLWSRRDLPLPRLEPEAFDAVVAKHAASLEVWTARLDRLHADALGRTELFRASHRRPRRDFLQR